METIIEDQLGNASENSNPSPRQDLILNQEAVLYLQGAAKWAGFLAIVHLTMMGLLALGIMMFILGTGFLTTFTNNYGVSGSVLVSGGIFYLIIIGIISIPIWWLYQFSRNSKQAISNNDNQQIANALHLLNRYFKFYGILTIITLTLYVIGFLVFFLVIFFFNPSYSEEISRTSSFLTRLYLNNHS